jgi:hypothetical protein
MRRDRRIRFKAFAEFPYSMPSFSLAASLIIV